MKINEAKTKCMGDIEKQISKNKTKLENISNKSTNGKT